MRELGFGLQGSVEQNHEGGEQRDQDARSCDIWSYSRHDLPKRGVIQGEDHHENPGVTTMSSQALDMVVEADGIVPWEEEEGCAKHVPD